MAIWKSTGWASAFLTLVALTISACSTPEQRAAESSRAAASSAAEASANAAYFSSAFAEASRNVAAADDVEVPSDYEDPGNGIAFKWLESTSSEYVCDYGKCSNLKVFAYRGCPSGVYGKANFVNSSGTVVGWTNDTLGSLPRGSYGILRFVYTGSASSIRTSLTELDCS